MSSIGHWGTTAGKDAPVRYETLVDCPERRNVSTESMYFQSKSVSARFTGLLDHTNPHCYHLQGQCLVFACPGSEIRRPRHCFDFPSPWSVHPRLESSSIFLTRPLLVSIASDLLRHTGPIMSRIWVSSRVLPPPQISNPGSLPPSHLVQRLTQSPVELGAITQLYAAIAPQADRLNGKVRTPFPKIPRKLRTHGKSPV